MAASQTRPGLAHGLHATPSCWAASSANRRCGRCRCPGAAASWTNSRDHVVGISGVADGVRGAQQHLEADVGNGFAQAGAGAAKGSSCRKRMATSKVAPPHISRLNRFVQPVRDEVGDRQHVVGAHARGQQRLVGVAEGGVGDQQALLLRASTRRSLPGPSSSQQLARAVGRRGGVVRRHRRRVECASGRGLPGDCRDCR